MCDYPNFVFNIVIIYIYPCIEIRFVFRER